jgi:predicted metal-binding protein
VAKDKNLKWVKKEEFPPFIDSIIVIDPKDLPISATARLGCQGCGLYNRAILCPPLLKQTYPQFATLNSSIEYFREFSFVFIYVFKNDGTKAWWLPSEHDNYKHLNLIQRKGRSLKGAESSSARWLTRMMRKIKAQNEKNGFLVDCFIQGHCDFCAKKCPNRNNPPCVRGGLASMEATGINVYRLLSELDIKYEYPVINYLTQVTMMVVA